MTRNHDSVPLQSVSPLSNHSSPLPSTIVGRDHDKSPQDVKDSRRTRASNVRNNASKSKIPRQSLYARVFGDSWLFEELMWLLAAIAFTVILVVLHVFDGQPLEDWHYSSLTLNAMINIVSQISQTAIFVPVASSISQLKWIWYRKSRPIGDMEDFDRASRGTIDSLALVFKRPKWILVYLGATNMGLILLFGSFAQQSVYFPLRENDLPSAAALIMPSERARIHERDRVLFPPNIALMNAAYVVAQGQGNSLNTLKFNVVAPGMEVAINKGLLERNASPASITAACATGNCTFQDYTSLGICSSVEDVTPTIVEYCPQAKRDTNLSCSYNVPSLQTSPTPRGDNLTTGQDEPTLWIGASRVADDYSSGPATLVEFYVLYFPDVSILDKGSKTNTTASLVALRGSLKLCLKKYCTAVVNGITDTTVLESLTDLDWQTKHDGSQDIDVITWNDTKGNEYWIGKDTLYTFNDYLAAATFYGQYYGAQPHDSNLNDATSSAARAFATTLYGNQTKGIQGVKDLLVNLETSMSNALRTTSSIPSTVHGKTTRFEPYIAVDFRWLIVPILSLVLALFFLLAVIFESRRLKVPTWKSDQTAALFAIEPRTRVQVDQLDSAQAKSVSMQLGQDDRGRWQLRGPTAPG